MLRSSGAVVFSADEIASDLTENDENIKRKIVKVFGAQSYHSSTNLLERSYISDIVFSDPQKLHALNSIVHPAVIQAIEQQCAQADNPAAPYVGIEAAIMFESGLYKKLDYVLGVVSDDEKRIDRVKKRDGFTEKEIMRRMNSQLPADQLVEKSDFIVYNNETKDALSANVAFFHSLFLTLPPKRKQ